MLRSGVGSSVELPLGYRTGTCVVASCLENSRKTLQSDAIVMLFDKGSQVMGTADMVLLR